MQQALLSTAAAIPKMPPSIPNHLACSDARGLPRAPGEASQAWPGAELPNSLSGRATGFALGAVNPPECPALSGDPGQSNI